MDASVFKGTISFINHAKKNAMIDYEQGGKKKTVSFITELAEKTGKKSHKYRVGDEVKFKVKLTDRGDKMTAFDIRFLYNTALEKLIQRARIDNRFKGYIKLVDEDYYIKELDSYLFFPLAISKWEKAPEGEEAIDFRFLDPDKPNNITAELFTHDFIPEYKKAQHHVKSKTPVEGIVTKVSPYAVYLDLFGGKMQAKLDLKAVPGEPLKEGDTVKLVITYLAGNRIAVEKVQQGL